MTDGGDPRERLEELRRAALARAAGLDREFAAIVEAAGAANGDDEHDPEGATIAYERQHVAALLSQARADADEVAAAIRRLDGGRYGSCTSCGRPIAAAPPCRPSGSRDLH